MEIVHCFIKYRTGYIKCLLDCLSMVFNTTLTWNCFLNEKIGLRKLNSEDSPKQMFRSFFKYPASHSVYKTLM